MSVTLKYLKSRPVAKATFRLPAEAAPKAKKVHLVGDFNDWNEKATPMERLKDGTFKVVLDLDAGQAYSFRYLIDGKRWENDWDATRYEPHPFGDGDNSVVQL
ncbi:isoamylase early set domain-containing protein [bacterium]|nr:isoamylase early set domain-containing protein [bacterium]HPF36194.1 isoamylase early set domain-containing protein [Candidatus Krumholzibacteria bacterium]HRX49887.1 isoamylase early set domain-containing protein [Candidatus Krumholzibacteria bacterium]